ncbi:hypothetical protein ACFYM0_32930 [Streptomyces sp. NPDC006487]|uniref:ALF repeat-containing protein n=1 Tax=Streptomyces sp. NPDC006487 TaxID=3364748 RepID=UPI0036B8CAE2
MDAHLGGRRGCSRAASTGWSISAIARHLGHDRKTIRDFYTTGQHEAAKTDYRVEITKLSNEGSTSVKEAAKKALEDGTTKALLTFIKNTQFGARSIDERATATKLFNDGGPEVKAAAKIALNAAVNDVHSFVDAGQYMADRKDQLAYTHIGTGATYRSTPWCTSNITSSSAPAGPSFVRDEGGRVVGVVALEDDRPGPAAVRGPGAVEQGVVLFARVDGVQLAVVGGHGGGP